MARPARQSGGHPPPPSAEDAPGGVRPTALARFALGLALFGILTGGGAHAQMMLPGANNGVAPDVPPKAAGGGEAASAPIRPVVIKPPAETTILGHALSRDGKSGSMTFDKIGDDIVLTRLRLDGDRISKPQETCSVDVSIETPIVVTPAGRPTGTLRFDVPLEICPLTIDILDGAVLASRPEPSCDFKAADCRVTPGGLWGPAAIDITPARAADLEHQRVRIETTMRTNFRALLKKAGKDRAAVKAIAREQAAFSSQREMTCRDYDLEPVHGFCSTQITEARALELLSKFGLADDAASDHRHAAKAKPQPPIAGAPPQAIPAPTTKAAPPPQVAPAPDPLSAAVPLRPTNTPR